MKTKRIDSKYVLNLRPVKATTDFTGNRSLLDGVQKQRRITFMSNIRWHFWGKRWK